MRYVDTSVLVVALTKRSDTQGAQDSIADVPAGTLLISDWVITEFSAALAAKIRAGKLHAIDHTAAARTVTTLQDSVFTTLAVTSAHFAAAARLAASDTVTLRAGDALHLAVASAAEATMYTLDQGLHRAAEALRLPSVLVSSAEESVDPHDSSAEES